MKLLLGVLKLACDIVKGGENEMAKVYFLLIAHNKLTYKEFIAKGLNPKLVAQVEELIDVAEMEYLRNEE